MSKLASWLIAILLVALVGVAGMLDSTTGLLMLSPFATIYLILLVGFYPGESVIEALAQIINRSPRVSRRSWLSLPPITGFLAPSALVPGSLGSRGPPFCV